MKNKNTKTEKPYIQSKTRCLLLIRYQLRLVHRQSMTWQNKLLAAVYIASKTSIFAFSLLFFFMLRSLFNHLNWLIHRIKTFPWIQLTGLFTFPYWLIGFHKAIELDIQMTNPIKKCITLNELYLPLFAYSGSPTYKVYIFLFKINKWTHW